MNIKAETGPDTLDTVKLAVALMVALGGFVAYYYYSDTSVLLRLPGLFACAAVAVAIAFQSAQGRQIWEFIKGSQVEIRKVVWPTRQETMNTTLMVILFTVVLGVFFLGVDWILLQITQYVTGRGG